MVKDITPTFPPLLSGHGLAKDKVPMNWARSRAGKGKLGAGDLVWSRQTDYMRYALVLEPDVPRHRCGEMVFVAMTAFGDAAGALIPPEVAITYQWPGCILMNEGQIGYVDLIIAEDEADGVPDWMVLSIDIQMKPDFEDLNPGENYHQTTMWDEGCGDMTRTELLESTARHTLNAIHNWSEDGFRPVHEQWTGRLSKENPVAVPISSDIDRFIGLDESGNALVSADEKNSDINLFEALSALRSHRQNG